MKSESINLKLFDYFFSQDRSEIERAIREFFGSENLGPNGEIMMENDEEEALFMDWITFDLRLKNGRKLIENYLSEKRNKLSQDEVETLENMLMNKYGFYEVMDFMIDKWIDLLSLQSGQLYRVKEKMGTHAAFKGQILLCRVGKTGRDEWMMIGSNPVELPASFGAGTKEMLLQSKDALSPKDTRQLFIKHS